MKILYIILVAISISISCKAEGIYVHFSGYIQKPGIYQINEWSNLKDLEKSCGGWTEFSSVKNLMKIKIIRFARREGQNGGANMKQINTVVTMDKLPVKNGKFQFQKGDIIYVPSKVFHVK